MGTIVKQFMNSIGDSLVRNDPDRTSTVGYDKPGRAFVYGTGYGLMFYATLAALYVL